MGLHPSHMHVVPYAYALPLFTLALTPCVPCVSEPTPCPRAGGCSTLAPQSACATAILIRVTRSRALALPRCDYPTLRRPYPLARPALPR